MAVPCTIIMAATVLTALMPPIYCLEEPREPSRDPRRHGENMQTPRRDLPIVNSKPPIPLSMVLNAVDDMYKGCTKKMEKVEKKYFKNENEGKFKKAWDECSKKKYPKDKTLTKNHMRAICAYTSYSHSRYKNNKNDKKLYEEFNEAVQTNRSIYDKSSFRFHFLHYWLTTAIQSLNRNNYCYITYRKTNVEFTGKVNHMIRFGRFASSSFNKNLDDFGTKSCFKIKTCLGANLTKYAEDPTEEEVLIPPYETFKITKIITGRGKFKDLMDCEKVFILESKGEESNLNCKLAPK